MNTDIVYAVELKDYFTKLILMITWIYLIRKRKPIRDIFVFDEIVYLSVVKALF